MPSYLFCYPILVLQFVQGRVVGSGGGLLVRPPIVSRSTVAAPCSTTLTSEFIPKEWETIRDEVTQIFS